MKKHILWKLMSLMLITMAGSCKKENTTPPIVVQPPVTDKKVTYTWDKFCMGADLSYVNEVQDYGGAYKDSGSVKDPYLIFKSHGANLVRVRLWHDPKWIAPLTGGKLYSDIADVEKTIQRAKAAGMAVSLDLHYSDEWADPGKQFTPEAWKDLDLTTLKDSVYQYTLKVLNRLKSKNLTPEMIQIGNETNQGMLFPLGKVENNNWASFGELIKSGAKAVRDFSATSTIKPQIIVHVAQLPNAEWFANGLTSKGGVSDFDIIGLSHYYLWSTTTMTEVKTVIQGLKTKYNKKVMIVETSYPWTTQNADSYSNVISGSTTAAGYEISKEGQLRYMKDLTQQVIAGGGSGIMYWEPAWITSSLKDAWGTGSSYENCAFFDFTGNTLPAIDFMTYPYQF